MKTNIDVVLIRAKGYFSIEKAPPIGITCIASYISDKYSVKILDRECETDENYSDFVKNKITPLSPRIVGISSMSAQVKDAMSLGKTIKEYLPQARIVFGGAHFSSVPEDYLEYGHAVIVGEGETIFKEICGYPQDRIKGIFFGKPLDNIDDIPIPSDELLIASQEPKDNQYLFLSSRGCPFNCTYCLSRDIKQKGIRYHSIDYIIEYLKKIKRLYPNVKRIWFIDDVFIVNRKRVIGFCEKSVKEGFNFEYSFFAHANYVKDLSLFKKMVKYNFTYVYMGVESGNNEVLKEIKKSTTVEVIERAIKILKKSGLYPCTTFMIGNISETKETVTDSINFSKKLGVPAYFNFAEPFPGTEFFNKIKNNPQVGKIISNDFKPIHEITFVPKDLDEKTMHELMKKAQKYKAYKFRLYYCFKHPRKTLSKIKYMVIAKFGAL